MQTKDLNCPNCGAILKQDSDHRYLFCPFCGVEIPKEENEMIEFSKYVLKHEEEVRQRKVAEKAQEDRSSHRLLIGLIIGLLLIFGFVSGRHYYQVHQLNQLVIEIQEDIVAGRYDEASVKVTRVRLNDGFSGEETYKWNEQRKELEKLIKQKRGY